MKPESAYFECLHEMKLIIDMVNEGGLFSHALFDKRPLRSSAIMRRAKRIITEENPQGNEKGPDRNPERRISLRNGFSKNKAGASVVLTLSAGSSPKHPIEKGRLRTSQDDALAERFEKARNRSFRTNIFDLIYKQDNCFLICNTKK